MKDRVIKLWFCKVILTSKDYAFWDGEWIMLSDELGWWTDDGEIYVFTCGKSLLEVVGIAVHEVAEFILEKKFRFCHMKAHKIANVLEKIASLGKG